MGRILSTSACNRNILSSCRIILCEFLVLWFLVQQLAVLQQTNKCIQGIARYIWLSMTTNNLFSSSDTWNIKSDLIYTIGYLLNQLANCNQTLIYVALWQDAPQTQPYTVWNFKKNLAKIEPFVSSMTQKRTSQSWDWCNTVAGYDVVPCNAIV